MYFFMAQCWRYSVVIRAHAGAGAGVPLQINEADLHESHLSIYQQLTIAPPPPPVGVSG